MLKFPLYIHFLVLFIITGCVSPNTTFEKIPPGIWKGVLMLDRKPALQYGDDRDITKKFDIESELPFNFEVIYENDTSFYIVIHNADERIEVRDIRFGRDKATGKDTVEIDFPHFDTTIKALYEDGVMEGDWIVHYKENYRIPFKAVHGQNQRFDFVVKDTPSDFSGEWHCTFEVGTPDEYPATAFFYQTKNEITGTFLTETGDYRYLEGQVAGKKVYLSAFDGAHAFLFLGKLMEDGSIVGSFRSGSHFTTQWTGSRKSSGKVTLRNAYSITKAKTNSIAFTFPDENGHRVSLSDRQFENKSKLIQIMGTWCPNCYDETIFLKDYLGKNKREDVVLISLCFERYKDEKKALSVIKRYKQKLKLDHLLLYGGYYDKKEALKQIPQLDTLLSYPTLLFVDKNNQIKAIHTGFSGPATPVFRKFEEEFETSLQKLSTGTHIQ